MDIKVGDKVRVKRYAERPYYWNHKGEMDYLMGQVVTVKSIDDKCVGITEDARWLFDMCDLEPAIPFDIKRVIYNDPATIILWADGTKTVVKAHNEPFDKEKGLAMAILKKMLGRGFHRFLKENCKQE
jgi:hypothetical protein